MKITRHFWAVAGLFLLALTLVGCQETGKANELVDVGNKSVDEANKAATEAKNKFGELFTKENITDFPENRDSLKSKVAEVAGLFDKSVTNLKSAADKFEEASKLKLDDKFKEYLTTMAQSYRKKAELNETAKKTVLLLSDTSIDGPEGLASKMQPLNEQTNKLQKEAGDLEAKAQKIQTDNPSIFKK